MFNKICLNLLFWQYLRESQCILAILRPGKVNSDPRTPHIKAMTNFTISLEAGPLKLNFDRYPSFTRKFKELTMIVVLVHSGTSKH